MNYSTEELRNWPAFNHEPSVVYNTNHRAHKSRDQTMMVAGDQRQKEISAFPSVYPVSVSSHVCRRNENRKNSKRRSSDSKVIFGDPPATCVF